MYFNWEVFIINTETVQATLDEFRENKVMCITALSSLMGCAVVTMRKRLKAWNTHTSYNFNGSYYALDEVVRFNDCGIWEFNGIRFSRHGNLKQTVAALVNESERGLTAAELGKIIGIAPRSFLWHFRDMSGIRREKYQGQFIYFNDTQKKYRQQYQCRFNSEGQILRGYSSMAIDSEPVLILVDRIKHPDASIESCVNRLRTRCRNITVSQVRNFLQYHDLLKKTPHTG